MDVSTEVCNEQESFIPQLTEEVRNNLNENYHLSIANECTGFIVRCLRIKDYNVEKAAKLVKNFAKSTRQLHEILDKFQPKLYRDIYLDGSITALSSRDALGRQVLVFRLGSWNPKTFDFDDACAAIMLLFSYTVGQSVETQRKGIVFVHDLRGFGIQHVQSVKTKRLTQLIGLMQDGSPGRIKGVHMIFHPKVFSILYHLAKPFLKEKLVKRIHFHGDDVNSLHQHLSPDILPSSLGGTKSDSECYDLTLLNNLIAEDTIHKQLREHGVPDM